MAFDEKLGDRIREALTEIKNVEEKKMMGGLTFMVNDKMCLGIVKDELMVRLDPEIHEAAIKIKGCRTMDFTKRPMKGFVFVSPDGIKNKSDFQYWVDVALDYNKKAKATKKKKSKKV
ncbi:MAG: TfoX/Sxy family protein [Bacteroidota bacterium]